MTEPHVTISILNWNGGEDTLQCLHSIFQQDYENFSVIVSDNGSTDGSLEKIRVIFPQVQLIENGVNLGFTGGNNRAINYALDSGADYVWLLNSDAIVGKGCLRQLIECANSHEDYGLLSPAVYYQDDQKKLQFCGAIIDWNRQIISVPRIPELIEKTQAYLPNSIVLWGTALLIRRKVLEQIGLLDDRYFAYYEDMDFSVRVIRAGFLCHVVFSAFIWHQGHPTTHTRSPHFFYLMTRNGLLFWCSYLTRWQKFSFIRRHIAETLVNAANCSSRGDTAGQDACLAGLWDAATRHFGRRDLERKPPRLLTRFFMWRPYLIAALLKGELYGITRELRQRIFKKNRKL